MALIQSTAIPSGATDYELEQSLKFNDDDSAYLSWTPSSAGNRTTWTWSGWIKLGSAGDGWHMIFSAGSSSNGGSSGENLTGLLLYTDTLYIYWDSASGGTNPAMKLRDPSAWYHVCLVATSSSLACYINGTLAGTKSGSGNGAINNTLRHGIGVRGDSLTSPFDGYMSEINFIDGTAVAPSNFAETGTYGEWKPIEYSGTYGTNGFYLPFKNDYTVEGFSTVIYPGNSVADHYIGGTGFKPNLTWLKHRNHGTAHQHNLFDSVRGTHKTIHSNSTEAEETLTDMLSSFKPDGFTLGTSDAINDSGVNYVSWNWDMGADTPTGFGCVTYKGNGGTQDLSLGFEPDLVWIKKRTASEYHVMFDTVRGLGDGKALYPNAEKNEGLYKYGNVSKTNPDGFSLATGTSGIGYVNDSSNDYIAWGWDMGNTTATNTSGSINSQVRANTTYGQSIVSYTGNATSGATVGHGLSSAPEMIIVKGRESSTNWAVLHKGIATDYETDYITMNNASTVVDNVAYWNDTQPTNALFYLGNDNDVNKSGEGHIAYCFHSVSGYSKFGSYTGNGSTNGTTVTLGFRPAFLMIKSSTQAENWNVIDSTRTPLNGVNNARLQANTTTAEGATWEAEITDTGFQLKTTDGEVNANGETYIYMAFAGGMDSISDYNTTGSIDSRVKASTTYGQSIVSYTG